LRLSLKSRDKRKVSKNKQLPCKAKNNKRLILKYNYVKILNACKIKEVVTTKLIVDLIASTIFYRIMNSNQLESGKKVKLSSTTTSKSIFKISTFEIANIKKA